MPVFSILPALLLLSSGNPSDSANFVPPHPAEVALRSIILPAAGAWSIDQPLLATWELGIDALAISAILYEANHPIRDAGAGIPTIAGLALLGINRLLGIPTNALFAHLAPPPPHPEWTSRQEPIASVVFEFPTTLVPFLGIESGFSGYRVSAGALIVPLSDNRYSVSNDTTYRDDLEYHLARMVVERGWSVHPRLRFSVGMESFLTWGGSERYVQYVNVNAFEGTHLSSGESRIIGASVGPQLGLETTQNRWFASKARISMLALSSDRRTLPPFSPLLELGFRIGIPSGD